MFKLAQVILLLRELIKSRICHHIETSQLICWANQLTGFYMMTTITFNELTTSILNVNMCNFYNLLYTFSNSPIETLAKENDI